MSENPRGVDVNLRAGPQMEEYRGIADRIARDRPARVLDWGCGWGQISDLLLRAGLDVTLLDYRPQEPEGLRPLERFPHINAHISHDPRQLPFAAAEFDAVLSCGVLEHVEDPDASLEEIKRILKPGGRFYVYKLPNRHSYLEAIARRAGLYYHGAYEHDRVYSRKSAVGLLRRHAFLIEEFRRMNVLPLTVTGALSTRFSSQIWAANRALSAIPCLNLISTNLEIVARRPV